MAWFARSVQCCLAPIVAAALLAACAPTDILNALSPVSPEAVTRAIPYAGGPRRTLDVYRPNVAGKSAVIVFFYGGSWQDGDKESYQFVAAALARRGYAVVVPDYRVYPEVRYPAFLDDGARAVKWVRANIAQYGGDPRRIYVMGHSAGAYIAASLVIDPRWLAKVGMQPRRDIAGLIGLAGPYDFLPLRDPKLIEIFGGANRRDILPIVYVSPGTPRAFLATDPGDTTVEPGNTERLARRLSVAGNSVRVRIYRGVGHAGLIGAVAEPLQGLVPVADDIDAFIQNKLPRQ